MSKLSKDTIRAAYHNLGGESTFYDGMITCSTFWGKAVCRLVWAMGKQDNDAYVAEALSALPADFSGRLLEVPVGTGILSMPLYMRNPRMQAVCLDYSADMMARAKRRAAGMALSNVSFHQGDVGALPFEDETFDAVLSLNGFHAFPNKEAAYREVYRVLKPGGLFFGCFYVQGEKHRTDWIIRHVYQPRGFFTPPYETATSLQTRLRGQHQQVTVTPHVSIACFTCQK